MLCPSLILQKLKTIPFVAQNEERAEQYTHTMLATARNYVAEHLLD